MAHYSKSEVETATANLKKWLLPGDTIYTILRKSAPSGMSRVIQLIIIRGPRAQPIELFLGWNAAVVLGLKYDREAEGVRINGCGMDMGFELVYELGRRLYPRCKRRADGSYVFKHRWL